MLGRDTGERRDRREGRAQPRARRKKVRRFFKNILPSLSLSPPLQQTELCRTWLAGATCIYGDRCNFAHGVCELRAPPAVRLNSRGSGGAGSGRPSASANDWGLDCFTQQQQRHQARALRRAVTDTAGWGEDGGHHPSSHHPSLTRSPPPGLAVAALLLAATTADAADEDDGGGDGFLLPPVSAFGGGGGGHGDGIDGSGPSPGPGHHPDPSTPFLPPPSAHAWLTTAAHPAPSNGLILLEDDLLGFRAFITPPPTSADHGEWRQTRKADRRPRTQGSQPPPLPPPPPLAPPAATSLDDWAASPADADLQPLRPSPSGRRLPVFVELAGEE